MTEKEMIEGYAVEHAIRVGNHRYVFGISTDPKEPHRYMKCKERQESILLHYDNAIAGNDYVDVMKLFIKDVSDAIVEVEKERASLGIENPSCLAPNELIPFGDDEDLRGKVVALKITDLGDGCRDITSQLYMVESGYGAISAKNFKSCTARNLKSGEKYRIYRYEISGIVPDDKIPAFAKENLAKSRAEFEQKQTSERRNNDAR